MAPKPDRSTCVGSLLGGALGDALGAPVEFMRLHEIRDRYGPAGICELDEAFGRVGSITDDTQMTLFSAEGVIRARVCSAQMGTCEQIGIVRMAYQRWLHTQGEACDPEALAGDRAGWLVKQPALHGRREPGMTCLASLRGSKSGIANDSKGCGTVMRSAPFGFTENSWDFARDCAAITHGHIEAHVSAAILARSIHNIADGVGIEDAVLEACSWDECGTLSSSLARRAIALAKSDVGSEEAIASLGEGWVAEEALSIGVYSALVGGQDIELALRTSVNHDGDSDSTGSICGNLAGAFLGAGSLPSRWLDLLELREVIEQVATDLTGDPAQLAERYPGC